MSVKNVVDRAEVVRTMKQEVDVLVNARLSCVAVHVELEPCPIFLGDKDNTVVVSPHGGEEVWLS